MEFLDINLTKELNLLLHAIHRPFYWRIFKKTVFFSGFKNHYKKICETRKLESIHEWHIVEWKNEGRNQTKTRVRKGSSLCPETLTKNGVQEHHLRTHRVKYSKKNEIYSPLKIF